MSRVTEIRYVGYGVPDLAAERAFYTSTWGLKEVAEQDGMVYLATEGHDEPYVVRLRPTAEKRIDVISMAADTNADVDALHQRVLAAGCKVQFAPKALQGFGGGYGFRFFTPEGFPLEISAGVKRGTARELKRWDAVPKTISHIVLHSPDREATAKFFIDVLGFRLTDTIDGFMTFLRCNEWHHRFAIMPGPPCLNHVAFDMLGLDDMMRGIARIKKQGAEVMWGPGRHTVGDNTFCYFSTPNGFGVEITAELENVDFDGHKASVYPMNMELMEKWGIASGDPRKQANPAPDKGLFAPAEM